MTVAHASRNFRSSSVKALSRSLSTSMVPTTRPSTLHTGTTISAFVLPRVVRYRGSFVTSCTTTGAPRYCSAVESACDGKPRICRSPRTIPGDDRDFRRAYVVQADPTSGLCSRAPDVSRFAVLRYSEFAPETRDHPSWRRTLFRCMAFCKVPRIVFRGESMVYDWRRL